MTNRRMRIISLCTGIGIVQRGYESFFSEVQTNLPLYLDHEFFLIKGGGDHGVNEWVVPCLKRTHVISLYISRFLNCSPYTIEQISAFVGVLYKITYWNPHVIFYSDYNLGRMLAGFRRLSGAQFRLLLSNGAARTPPFSGADCVQQVAPVFLEAALQAGEDPSRHFGVPLGIRIPPPPEALSAEARSMLKTRLGMPADKSMILSVGLISERDKRMDYLVSEVARLPSPRPFLMMLGAQDNTSQRVIQLATELLGSSGFAVRTVGFSEVEQYYRAADKFVLASLNEGFGRVYLEALMHGRFVFAHDGPVMRYVVGDHGAFANLRTPGALASLLHRDLGRYDGRDTERARWDYVRKKFGWENLSPRYDEMFRSAAVLAG